MSSPSVKPAVILVSGLSQSWVRVCRVSIAGRGGVFAQLMQSADGVTSSSVAPWLMRVLRAVVSVHAGTGCCVIARSASCTTHPRTWRVSPCTRFLRSCAARCHLCEGAATLAAATLAAATTGPVPEGSARFSGPLLEVECLECRRRQRRMSEG